MKPLLTAAAAFALQASSLDEFYKFPAEKTWTYKRVENASERKVVARVTGETDGKLAVDWKEHESDGSLRSTTAVSWFVAEGILTVEARSKSDDGEETVLRFGLLKEGSKKGDTWKVEVGEFTHQGTSEVAVPAGTYKEALWTQLKMENGTVDFYLVPKVGLVKIVVTEPGGGDNRFELAEFK